MALTRINDGILSRVLVTPSSCISRCTALPGPLPPFHVHHRRFLRRHSMFVTPWSLSTFTAHKVNRCSVASKATVEEATFTLGPHFDEQHVRDARFEGVLETKSGYTGQQDGCRSLTKAVRITFDPTRTCYRDLLNLFWKQYLQFWKQYGGSSQTPKYKAAIWYHNAQQAQDAEDAFFQFSEHCGKKPRVDVLPATKWIDAVHGPDLVDRKSNGTIQTRLMCQRCFRAKRVCICSALPVQGPTWTETHFIVLMHPNEGRRTTGTARLCQSVLRNCEVIVLDLLAKNVRKIDPKWRAIEGIHPSLQEGLSDMDTRWNKILARNPKLCKALANLEGNSTLLLYPGPESLPLDQLLLDSSTMASNSSVEDGKRAHVLDNSRVACISSGGKGTNLTTPKTLILLDGTWSETRDILRCIPPLNTLQRASLPSHVATKADGRLMTRRCRQQKSGKSSFVCTLGAVVAALEIMEPCVAKKHRNIWLQPLHKLIEVEIAQLPDHLRHVKGQQVLQEYKAAGLPIAGPLSQIPNVPSSRSE
eukprot:gnl/MRDRNA2_/MRDRNA2_73739_c0_seq2.p1 gnl/MRDRNA2_/MRDRNA2_73739_c0~~gnl/MRDRNA2_/MRDRNA2_73739_c0_seq2.p1  ORF type:complete len:548 (-),score=71.81 gnl/MRDRNA2_/MRDRNA2_73739_c0_seq2:59-1654(-)